MGALLLAGGLLSPLPRATLGMGAVALFGSVPLGSEDLWRSCLELLASSPGAYMPSPGSWPRPPADSHPV
ncbi:MAG TPA: hypothetical protein VEZ71_10700 [Archangium sp.]|nr:hypothetical protein [Archangium sp.]